MVILRNCSAKMFGSLMIGNFCLLLLAILPIPIKTEVLLTNGTETAFGPAVAKGEGFWWKWVRVDDYHHMDQCMRQPDNSYIMSYAIVLQLFDDQIAGGNGLTICYPGQLEGDTGDGRFAGSKQHIYNQNGTLNKTCEEARQKLRAHCDEGHWDEEECNQFTGGNWHGINIRQLENSDDLVLTMSTTNYSFNIIRSWFKQSPKSQVVIKLTEFNSIIATLSKDIEPGYDESNAGSPYSVLMATKNHLSLEDDIALKKEFMKNVYAGASMRKYVGPWTLGADIMPRANAARINFWIIRSECSGLAAAFLLPDDKASSLLPKEGKDKFAKLNSAPIFEYNVTIELRKGISYYYRGKVMDNFTIEWINKQKSFQDARLQAVRIIVEFDKKKEAADAWVEKGDRSTKENVDLEWLPFSQANGNGDKSIEFHKGQHFRLKIIMEEAYFDVSMNCGPFVRFKFGRDKLRLNEDYRIVVKGHVQMFELPDKNATNVDTIPIHNNMRTSKPIYKRIEMKQGFLLRAKVNEDWKEIEVKLYKSTPSEENVLELVFELNDAEENVVLTSANKISDENHIFSDMNQTLAKIDFYELIGKNNRTMELYIEFDHRSFNVTLNDEHLANIELDHDPIVDLIKIDADINSLSHMVVTQEIPSDWKFPDTITDDEITITGKIKKDAQDFTISLYYADSKYDNMTSMDYKKCIEQKECLIALKAHFDINRGIVSLERMMGIKGESDPTYRKSGKIEIVLGKDFTVKMSIHKRNVTIDMKGAAGSIKTDPSQIKTPTPDRIHLEGGIVLFGEPTLKGNKPATQIRTDENAK